MRRCPALGARLLAELCLAPRTRLPALRLPSGVETRELRVDKRRLRVHVFGEGPLVVLVHGWQGAASQLLGLAESIRAAGFRVALFDMPAHGEAPGLSTSCPEFIRTLTRVARELGPLHAVVGHSLGASAALLAVAGGLDAGAVVALSPIPSFDFVMRGYVRAFGLSSCARELLARRLEARAQTTRAQLDLASVLPSVPTLLVHDRLDRIVPMRHSRRLQKLWTDVRLLETVGFGHRRLLQADVVAQGVVAFLATLPGAPELHVPSAASHDARA
jgi:pimeloyl-ACP methyl ester carboxylesterase